MLNFSRAAYLRIALAAVALAMAGCGHPKGPVHVGAVTDAEAEQRRAEAKKLIAEGYRLEGMGRSGEAANQFRKAQNTVDTVMSPAQWYEARIKYVETVLRFAPDSTAHIAEIDEIAGYAASPIVAKYPPLPALAKRAVARARLSVGGYQKDPDVFVAAVKAYEAYLADSAPGMDRTRAAWAYLDVPQAYKQHAERTKKTEDFVATVEKLKAWFDKFDGVDAPVLAEAYRMSSVAKREAAWRRNDIPLARSAVADARSVLRLMPSREPNYYSAISNFNLGKSLEILGRITPASKEVFQEAQRAFEIAARDYSAIGYYNETRAAETMAVAARNQKWLSRSGGEGASGQNDAANTMME